MTVPRMRAGTTDRQAAVDGLTRHFTEGRLNPQEFDERVGVAYAATYLDELPELFADLPEAQPQRRPGSGVRPRADSVLPGPAAASPPSWAGPRPPQARRLARVIPVVAVLALVLSIALMTHGLFLFPLFW